MLTDTPFADPVALIAGMIAAALVGLAKGGLGSVGVMAVPVLSLVMSPVQAAGIMLPILVVSDGFSLWTWWKSWHVQTLRIMLPGAVIGVGVGWATAAFVSDDVVRLIVGVVAVGFVLRWAIRVASAAPPHARSASWRAVSGAGLRATPALSPMRGGRPFRFMRCRSTSTPKR